ncbi:hypothetical protein Hypma_013592 [Hypsizygus marmoreus]|uniref:F-box domain-containing protein n=1 Tax=Hypsizygus marmoreus TaxID=39966 RepID=A0A369JIR2_HYPMA|nr:hypothetical protein Hypma_013592 [Hypsizygus marmoreus]
MPRFSFALFSPRFISLPQQSSIPEPTQPRKLPGQTHEHLHELQTKQRALETRVSELSRDLKTSEAALKRTRKQVIDLTNALAPISRVPDDILRSIFRTAYSDSAHQGQGAWRKPHHFTRRIASVTRRWRTIVTTDPSLFTHIDVWLERPLECLKLQLKRSSGTTTVPLAVTFDFGCHTWDDAWGTSISMESSAEFCAPRKHLDLMLAHVARWRTLSILAAGFRPVFDVFQHLKDLAAPALESVKVVAPSVHKEEANDFMIIVNPEHNEFRIFDGGAPLLRSVHVAGLEVPAYSDFPKEGLRRFRAVGKFKWSCKRFRDAVKGMVGLRELVINETLVKPVEGEDRVVEMPSVVSVRVENGYVGRWNGPSEALKWTIRNAEGTEFVLPFL